jgi:hypothetical protein
MATRAETKAALDARRAVYQKRKAEIQAAVLEHGGRFPDTHIAEMIGATENVIWRMRTALGIAKYNPQGDTEAKRAIVYEHYVVQGKPASAVGPLMGLTERQVRKIAQSAGWKRDRETWLKNSRAAEGRSAVTRRKTCAAKREAKQAAHDLLHPPIIQLSDAELIAKAMEAGKVTVLPTGHACGTTRWEAALHTSYPARALTSQEQRQRAARIMEAKGRHPKAAGRAA